MRLPEPGPRLEWRLWRGCCAGRAPSWRATHWPACAALWRPPCRRRCTCSFPARFFRKVCFRVGCAGLACKWRGCSKSGPGDAACALFCFQYRAVQREHPFPCHVDLVVSVCVLFRFFFFSFPHIHSFIIIFIYYICLFMLFVTFVTFFVAAGVRGGIGGTALRAQLVSRGKLPCEYTSFTLLFIIFYVNFTFHFSPVSGGMALQPARAFSQGKLQKMVAIRPLSVFLFCIYKKTRPPVCLSLSL